MTRQLERCIQFLEVGEGLGSSLSTMRSFRVRICRSREEAFDAGLGYVQAVARPDDEGDAGRAGVRGSGSGCAEQSSVGVMVAVTPVCTKCSVMTFSAALVA